MPEVRNKDIRRAMAVKGLRQWEVAEKVGYNSKYFSLLLNQQLGEEVKNKIMTAIEEMEGNF